MAVSWPHPAVGKHGSTCPIRVAVGQAVLTVSTVPAQGQGDKVRGEESGLALLISF